MIDKCPGQDINRRDIEEVSYELPCPSCHIQSIEFFFNDKTRRCPRCGFNMETSPEKLVQYFSCASWCQEARKCLGDERYEILKEAKRRYEE